MKLKKLKTRNAENEKLSSTIWSRYLGLFYATLTAVTGVLCMILVKYMRNFTSSELNLYQTIFELILILPFLIKDGTKLVFLDFWLLLILRTIFVTGRYYFRVFAIKNLPLGEANALYMSSPFFVAIAARIFLKDRFNKALYLSLGTIFLGFNLISRFWSLSAADSARAMGLGSVFLSVIANAMAEVVLKNMTKTQLPANLIVFYVSGFRTVYMLVLTELENGFTVPRIPVCSYANPLTSEPILLIVLSIGGLLAQVFLIQGIRRENPSAVSAVITTVALPSYLISQYLAFNDVPTPLTIAGTFLILFGSLLMNFAKIVEKMPDSSRLKKMFKILNE